MFFPLEEQLLEILRNLMFNVNRMEQIENLDILLDHQFYFDVSTVIFPQFNIQIIKIGEDRDLAPVEKLQALLELLSKKLQLDISQISPEEVLKGHYLHMFKLVRMLNTFSEEEFGDKDFRNHLIISRHNSLPILPQLEKVGPKSNSDKICSKLQQISNSISFENNDLMQLQQQNPGPLNQKQIEEKGNEKDQRQESENSPNENKPKKGNSRKKLEKQKSDKKRHKKTGPELVYLGDRQKNRALRVSKRNNNLKHQNDQIKLANKKFKSYLQTYMKPSKALKKRSNSQIRPKSAKIKTLYKDIEEIDNFFKSFEYQLRDQKQKYLRRMQQMIRNEENQRIWTNQRKAREEVKTMEKKKQTLVMKVNQGHEIRKQIVKEEAQNRREEISLKKKQQEKNIREKCREHKERRKKETENIKNYIQQMNNKVLMKFQEGGKFEQMVLNLYKRY